MQRKRSDRVTTDHPTCNNAYLMSRVHLRLVSPATPSGIPETHGLCESPARVYSVSLFLFHIDSPLDLTWSLVVHEYRFLLPHLTHRQAGKLPEDHWIGTLYLLWYLSHGYKPGTSWLTSGCKPPREPVNCLCVITQYLNKFFKQKYTLRSLLIKSLFRWFADSRCHNRSLSPTSQSAVFVRDSTQAEYPRYHTNLECQRDEEPHRRHGAPHPHRIPSLNEPS